MNREKKLPLKGSFPSALTSKEETIKAVSEFIENSEDSWISYKIPSFDWSTGERVKETNFLLSRSEWLADSNTQTEEALRAKSFLVVSRQPDGGLLYVDFSNRSWDIIDRSPKVDSELFALKRKLKGAVVSRFLSVGWGVSLLAGFITSAFFLFTVDLFIGLLINEEVRRSFFFGEGEPMVFTVISESFARRAVIITTPFLMTAGIGVFALRFMAGGLKVWPDKINRDLFHSIGFKMKKDFIPSSANTFWIALLGALAGAVVTKLFF